MRWPMALVVVLALWACADLVLARSPGWPELFAYLVGLLLIAWASTDPKSQGFASATWRGRAGNRRVALTFDDGPDPVGTPRVLDALAARGVRATFFVVAERALQHPQIIERAAAEGHQIELHGWNHRWQQWLTPSRARKALRKGVAAIEELTGQRARWVRPPFGVMLPALGTALASAEIRLVGWSRRAGDGGGGGNAQRMLDRLMRTTRDGDILLLHDGPHVVGGELPKGPELVEPFIEAMSERRLQLVTLDELLDDTD